MDIIRIYHGFINRGLNTKKPNLSVLNSYREEIVIYGPNFLRFHKLQITSRVFRAFWFKNICTPRSKKQPKSDKYNFTEQQLAMLKCG